MRTLAALTVVLTGCAPLVTGGTRADSKNAGGSGDARAEAERVSKLTRDAANAAETRCAPFERREVPFDEERRVGAVFATAMLRTRGAWLDEGGPRTKVNERVAVVGHLLARRSARPELQWTFGVVESDAVDARGFPGGYVFVTTGLLARLHDEAELAAVLAHEVAHVAARDPLTRYTRAVFLQCIAARTVAELARAGVPPSEGQKQIVMFAERFADPHRALLDDASEGSFERFLLDVAMMLAQGGHDREEELVADANGLTLMAFAGYDTASYAAALTSLEGGAWLLNGPPIADRVARVKALREGELAPFATGSARPGFKFEK
jgi:Zn-dependent protease with chaperone function